MVTFTPKPRRRWYQFSLRTLLVVVLVGAVFAGWVRWRMRWAQDNRERRAATIGWIEDKGGRHDAIRRVLRSRSWLERLFDDPGRASAATSVWMVNLDRTQVIDSDLEQLKALTNLEELRLSDTQITDAGLAHLKGIPKLKILSLNGTPVTDAGLEHLRELSSLERVGLSETRVTDAGLEHLKGLTNLQVVDVFQTQVTADGASELRLALPKCQIVTEPGVENFRRRKGT